MNFLRKYFRKVAKVLKSCFNKKELNSPMAYLLYAAVGGLAVVTVVRNYQANNENLPKEFTYSKSLDSRLTSTEKRLGGIEKNIKKIVQLNDQHRKAAVNSRIEREVNNQLKNVKARSRTHKNRKKKLAKLINELVDEA